MLPICQQCILSIPAETCLWHLRRHGVYCGCCLRQMVQCGQRRDSRRGYQPRPRSRGAGDPEALGTFSPGSIAGILRGFYAALSTPFLARAAQVIPDSTLGFIEWAVAHTVPCSGRAVSRILLLVGS